MKRIALALSLSALGCLVCCVAPVLLLLIGGASVGAALAEWRNCYRDPFLLGTAAVVGSTLVFLGARTWLLRRKAQRVTVSAQSIDQGSHTPIACTLASGDLKVRLEELAELSQSALLEARREDLTLYLRYVPEAEKRVRNLVEKERECCGFLNFEIDAQPQSLALRITAPDSAREAVQDIYAQFVMS